MVARNGPRPTKYRDYFRIFGGAVLLSVITASVQISQGAFGSGGQTTDSQDLRDSSRRRSANPGADAATSWVVL